MAVFLKRIEKVEIPSSNEPESFGQFSEELKQKINEIGNSLNQLTVTTHVLVKLLKKKGIIKEGEFETQLEPELEKEEQGMFDTEVEDVIEQEREKLEEMDRLDD